MVPLAMAFSRIFWSAAVAFSMSAHCARGILQNPMYEYIGGFSLTSDVCAPAGTAQTAAIASAQSPAKTLHTFLFMIFILRNLARISIWVTWATAVYTNRLVGIRGILLALLPGEPREHFLLR